jgi:hypothetical protein
MTADTLPRTNGRAPIGATGLPIFSGYLRLDPNYKLHGLEAIRVYRDMAWNEPACRALLGAALNLLHTTLTPVAGGESDADKEAAEQLGRNLEQMDVPMGTAVRQMYSMLWAGYAIHEQVLRQGEGGGVAWAAWEYRRQDSFYRWLTEGDDARVVGWEQRPAPSYRLRQIPLSRCIHVVADDSEGSPEGMSVLRGMYRPWRFLQNFELFMGIAGERFGSGLPVFEVEAGVALTEGDEAAIAAIGDGLRQNERAWLLLPAGVRFRFAESPGLDVNTYLEIIRYLRLVMLSTALADFIGLGTQNSGAGAYSLSQDKSELFLLALNGWQDRVADAINRQAVRRLYALPANRVNRFGTITAPPRVALAPVKRYDLEKLGQFLGVLQKVGAWTPTAADEAYLREISDLMDRSEAQITQDREEQAAAMPAPTPAPDEAGAIDEEGDLDDTDATDAR